MERKIFTNNMHSQTKSQTTIESVRPTFKVQNPHYKFGPNMKTNIEIVSRYEVIHNMGA